MPPVSKRGRHGFRTGVPPKVARLRNFWQQRYPARSSASKGTLRMG